MKYLKLNSAVVILLFLERWSIEGSAVKETMRGMPGPALLGHWDLSGDSGVWAREAAALGHVFSCDLLPAPKEFLDSQIPGILEGYH